MGKGGGSTPKAVAPKASVPVAVESNKQVQNAKNRDAEEMARMKGRASTILTGANSQDKKTILGIS